MPASHRSTTHGSTARRRSRMAGHAPLAGGSRLDPIDDSAPIDSAPMDRSVVDGTRSALAVARRVRCAVFAAVPMLVALLTLFVPSAAIAAGQGELQIGATTFTAAGPVHAAPAAGPVPMVDPDEAAGLNPDAVTNNACSGTASDNAWVPLVRWESSLNSHHALLDDGFFDRAGQTLAGMRSIALEGPGSLGQSLWGWTAQFTGFAVDFCPMVAAGPYVDAVAADVGDAVLSAGLGSMLVAVSIILIAWRLLRASAQGAAALKRAIMSLILPLMLAALFVASIAGAQQSTEPGSGPDADTQFVPGVMSPAWMMLKTTNVLNAAATGPLQAMQETQASIMPSATGRESSRTEAGSCFQVTDTWVEAGGSPGTRAVSDLWQPAGVRYYVDSQYGSPDNPIGMNAYCRTLDWKAGLLSKSVVDEAPNDKVYDMPLADGGNGPNLSGSGPGPRFEWTADDPAEQEKLNDASLVGWMVCRPTDGSGKSWEVIDGAGVESDTYANTLGVAEGDCYNWWIGYDSSKGAPDNLELDAGASDQIEKLSNPALREALLQIHAPSEPSLGNGIALLISGIVAIVVFGIVDLVIIGAKLGAIVLGLFLIGALLIGQLTGTERNLARYAKRTSAVLVVAVAAQAIFVLITLLAAVVVQLGAAFFGSSAGMTALWAGIAPLVAVGLLHFGSKSLTGGVSPFTLSGAKAMATTGLSPAMGAGLAGLAGGMALRGRQLEQGARNLLGAKSEAGKDAANTGTSKGSGTGKRDGKGAMQVSADPGHAQVTGSGEKGTPTEADAAAASVAALRAGGMSRMDRRRAHAEALAHERARSKGAGQTDEYGRELTETLRDRKAGHVVGYNAKGEAVTKRELAGKSHKDRRQMRGEMRHQSRADRKILAMARREEWAGLSRGEKLQRAGGHALTGVAATARAGSKAATWALDHKRQAAMLAGATALAATGVGIPTAAALAASAGGYHLARHGVRRSMPDAHRLRQDQRAARTHSQRILAEAAISNGGVQARAQQALSQASDTAARHQARAAAKAGVGGGAIPLPAGAAGVAGYGAGRAGAVATALEGRLAQAHENARLAAVEQQRQEQERQAELQRQENEAQAAAQQEQQQANAVSAGGGGTPPPPRPETGDSRGSSAAPEPSFDPLSGREPAPVLGGAPISDRSRAQSFEASRADRLAGQEPPDEPPMPEPAPRTAADSGRAGQSAPPPVTGDPAHPGAGDAQRTGNPGGGDVDLGGKPAGS